MRDSDPGPGQPEQLYQRYGTLVYRRALRLLGDEASARDVCHDVFVQVLRAGAAWRPPSPVGWLYTATTNACLNLLRGRRRWRRMLEGRPRLPTADAELPLGALLKSVPTRLQEIAIYYGLEGLSQSEIAVVLGVSEKTVWSRLQELRQLLGERPGLAPTLEGT
jgi:RNA polymerase sigma factor (sigma-70 family)